MAADSRENRPRREGASGKSVAADVAANIPPDPPGRKVHRTVAARQISPVSTSRPDGQRADNIAGSSGHDRPIFLARKNLRPPKHAAVVFGLGNKNLVYEDTRYFGRLTLDTSAVNRLGPEPLDDGFDRLAFARTLKRSRQAIKIKLLDQALVAGIGNIYASEALFRAGISPRLPTRTLTVVQVTRLWRAIRKVLAEAIACGSTVPLNFGGSGSNRLFYFGRAAGAPDYYEERLRVYDRAGRPCRNCDSLIKRIRQAGRSTFYCPQCQSA